MFDMTVKLPSAMERHTRIESYTRRLRRALRDCSNRELEILIRYYTRGQNTAQVAGEMGCRVEEVEHLLGRMRRAVRAERPLAKAAAGSR